MFFHTHLTNKGFYIECVIEAQDRDRAAIVLSSYADMAAEADREGSGFDFGDYTSDGDLVELVRDEDGDWRAPGKGRMVSPEVWDVDFEHELGKVWMLDAGPNG